MPNISSAWYLTYLGVDYQSTEDGSSITYRVNNPSDALFIIDNTNDTYSAGLFQTEQEVNIKIGSTLMFTGYITSIDSEWLPNRKKFIKIKIIDWGSFWAGKIFYENNYKYSTPAEYIYSISKGQITGLLTTGSASAGTSSISKNLSRKLNPSPPYDYIIDHTKPKLKREFYGTYVKDHWQTASEVAGADYFVDENKVLWVFPHGDNNLLASNSVKYKVQDTPSTAVNEIMVRMDRPTSSSIDATNRFRRVTVSNGIYDTFPLDANTFTSSSGLLPYPETGVLVPINFDIFGLPSDWNTNSGITTKPVEVLAQQNIGNTNADAYKFNIKDQSMVAYLVVKSSDANWNKLDWNLDYSEWDNLSFFINNSLIPDAVVPNPVDRIDIKLWEDTTHFTYKNIYNDINKDTDNDGIADTRTGWVLLDYNLTDAKNGANGWIRSTLVPSKINYISFSFYHNNSLIHYNVGSWIGFSQFYFYRRMKYRTSIGSALYPAPAIDPLTEKIIIDASAQSVKNLQTLAEAEKTRSNIIAKRFEFTISGNTDFKKPGYEIQIELSNLLGSGASTTQARMEQITHKLESGIHLTDIIINPAYQRN